jgi:hypothetical protein
MNAFMGTVIKKKTPLYSGQNLEFKLQRLGQDERLNIHPYKIYGLSRLMQLETDTRVSNSLTL